MTDYATIQTNVTAALLSAGTTCTLRQVTETFNTGTGVVSTSNTDYTGLPCVLLPMGEAAKQFGAGSAAFSDLFDGSTKRERRFCLLSAGFAATPKTGDLLTAASTTWEVLGVDPLAPDGSTTVLYQLGLQK